MQPGASIPLLCLLLLAGASSGLDGPFPRTAAAAVAPSGAVEGNVAAAMGWEEGRRGQLMMEGTDEEWDADVEAEAEEEEDEELVAMELAPPCGAFPTFVWGGKPSYLEGQGVYETRSVSHIEAARALTAAANKGGKAGAAEIAVVLVAPPGLHAHSAGLASEAFPGVRALVAEMPSSKVMPCVTRASAAPVAEAYTTARTTGVEPSELVAFLASSPDILSNGALDVVVSSLPHDAAPAAVDALLGEVAAALKVALPDGRFLLSQTTEYAPGHPIAAPRPQHRRRVLQATVVDDGYYPKQYLYATPTLVAGLLSAALLITIAYIGASVLLSLQGPQAWIHAPIPAGKEY